LDHIPCLPSAPLFPYTTLFRSQTAGVTDRRAERGLRAGVAEVVRLGVLRVVQVGGTDGVGDAVEQGRGRGRVHPVEVVGGVGALDRKSTRLNSSHVKISYAVFC